MSGKDSDDADHGPGGSGLPERPGRRRADHGCARRAAGISGAGGSHRGAEAARLGMSGSPTILLDGVDPFAAAGAVPSVSCRIYRGPDGAADGAPSVQDLTAALSAAGL